MKFNELDIKKHRKITRAGRGIAAGRGKTAGRGTKGQKSRTGGNIRPGFEGGQTSLVGRLPKLRGFTSHRTPKTVVYTSQIESMKDKKVDNFALLNAKIISDAYVDVKLVVKGDLTTAKEIELQAASANAVEMVQKAGGSFSKVPKPQRQKKTGNADAK